MSASSNQPTRVRTSGAVRTRRFPTLLAAGAAQEATSRCQFCSNRFRYPAFREGQLLLCPLCGLETIAERLGREKDLPAERYPLEVRDLNWHTGLFGVRYIAGIVINQSADTLEWVKVDFELFNDSDDLLGSASDHLRGFGVGRVWTFKAPVFSPVASRALLADVRCPYGSLYSSTLGSYLAGAMWRPPVREAVLPNRS